MTNLINDLLTFSRLSASILFERTDLNAIVKDVLMDLEWAIIEKDAKVETNTLPVIDAVSGQMRQVFQNIISNALKFSKHDTPPYIKINVTRVNALSTVDSFDPEGGFFRITIEDNGIGFNSQYADRIFNIFQRLHSREKYDGTGIGLSITKKIIEKHNGIIASNSIEGQGTVFIIVLPEKQERGEMVHKKIMVN
jgi:two-component system CheB/CheR fusion protein